MKKLIRCILLIFACTLNGQSLIQYTSEGKIGFKDRSGNIITPAKYETVRKVFDNQDKVLDNLYMVQSNSKFGIIDKHGTEIIKLKYTYIGKYSEDVFPAIRDSKAGYLDISGREIFPFTYNFPMHFSEGVASIISVDDKYALFDKSGKEIVAPKYKYLRLCSQGIILGELNGKFGFIKKNGEEITPFIYTADSQSFSEGLAVVRLNKKSGFIDQSGKVVIPIIYDQAKSFYKGVAIVKLNDKYLMIDRSGKQIKELNYDIVYRSPREDLINVILNKKAGRINIATGKEIIPPIYDVMELYKEDFSAWVQLNNKWGVIDKLGKIITPIQYDEKKEYHESGNYNYKVKINNKYGLLDADNKELTEVKYDSIGNYSEGFVLAKIGDKYGFIDLLGHELKPLAYKYAVPFSEGFASIFNKGQWYFLNTKGEELPLLHKESHNYQWVGSFSEGLCPVMKNNKFGFVNKNRSLIIPMRYDDVSKFERGFANVKVNNKWGTIDYVGNEILAPEYDKIVILYDGNIRAFKDEIELYFDKTGGKIENPY